MYSRRMDKNQNPEHSLLKQLIATAAMNILSFLALHVVRSVGYLNTGIIGTGSSKFFLYI